MNPSFFLIALCLGVASAAPKLDGSLEAQWHRWKATHGKVYDPDEEGWRRRVWEKNKKMLDQHNQEYKLGRQNFTLGMNAFTDMTNEEFTQVMNGFQNQKCKKGRVFQEPYVAEIPATVDWRKEGYVTPVKHQVSS